MVKSHSSSQTCFLVLICWINTVDFTHVKNCWHNLVLWNKYFYLQVYLVSDCAGKNCNVTKELLPSNHSKITVQTTKTRSHCVSTHNLSAFKKRCSVNFLQWPKALLHSCVLTDNSIIIIAGAAPRKRFQVQELAGRDSHQYSQVFSP